MHTDRGLSNVVGYVLLFGITITIATTIMLTGTATHQAYQTNTDVQTAVNALTNVNTHINTLTTNPTTHTQIVPVTSTTTGVYNVTPNAGEIRVTHTTPASEVFNVTRTPGAITYTNTNDEIAVQNGAVWRTQPGTGTAIALSNPPLHHTDSTVTLTLIELRRQNTPTDLTRNTIPVRTRVETRGTGTDFDTGTTNITITSQYYRAWADQYRDTTADVTVTPDANTTTITYTGTDTLHVTTHRVETQLNAKTASITTGGVDSQYDCEWVTDHINANAGDVDVSDQPIVCDVLGDVPTTDTADITLDDESVLVGDITTDGAVNVMNSRVHGVITVPTASPGTDIDITQNSHVTGDVSLPYSGTQKEFELRSASTITGDIIAANADMTLDSARVTGHIYTASTDVDCTDMTIGPDNKTCSEYTFRDPSTHPDY